MKKTLLIILMCIASLAAKADVFVWNYRTTDDGIYVASILSGIEFIDGDYDKQGTTLAMFVCKREGKNRVEIELFGDYTTHDLNSKRNYIVVQFQGDVNEKRWKVNPMKRGDSEYSRLNIIDADLFIKKLKKAEWFSITLPVFSQGATTFNFNCNYYPLEW